MIRQFPYVISYLVEDDRIVVIAVVHGRRNPGATPTWDAAAGDRQAARRAVKEVLSREVVKKSSKAWAQSPTCRRRKSSKKRIESDISGFKEVAGKAGLQAQ